MTRPEYVEQPRAAAAISGVKVHPSYVSPVLRVLHSVRTEAYKKESALYVDFVIAC
jgi:hypothetical protein